MSNSEIKEMVLDLVANVDYDICKELDEESINALIKIVRRHLDNRPNG